MTDYNNTPIGSGYNTSSSINTELSAVETAVNSKVDKSGSTLTGDLDMNSNQILNLPDATTAQEPLTLGQASSFIPSANFTSADAKFIDSVALAKSDSSLAVGDVIILKDRADGIFDVVLTAGVTPNTYNIIISTADALISFVLRDEFPLNVLSFGATANGSTNDIGAIQATIDHAKGLGVLSDSSAGSEVRMPQGQYSINDTIVLHGGFSGSERISLIGAGSGSTTIKLANNSNVDMIKYNSTNGFNHCRLEGLLLDGNRANQTQKTATITGISKASPAVITATNTYSDGDLVSIKSVSGMTEINELHGVVSGATSSSFSLLGVNSTGFTTYTSGGTVTEEFRGIYALRAFSGSRFTDLKINDIAGPAIDCELVSNAPLMKNIGITRAGTHGLYIHNSNNDGISVENMEIGTAGLSGIGNPIKVYNISGAGHGNLLFTNCRNDNGGAPNGIDTLISIHDSPVSITFVNHRWRMNSDTHSTYNMIKIEGTQIPYISIIGYGADAAPIAVTQNLINDTVSGLIHIATHQEPIVTYNCPVQQIEVTTGLPTHKIYTAGNSDPRFQLTARGPQWGSGSATPDVEIRRNSSTELAITNTSGTEVDLRVNDLKLIGGTMRMDEVSSPTGIADKGLLYCKDVAGKTALFIRFGTGSEIQLAVEV